jgi:hypothetical protein
VISGGRSVGIVRLRTTGHGVFLFLGVISLKWANCLNVIVRQPSEQRQMPKGRDEPKIALC